MLIGGEGRDTNPDLASPPPSLPPSLPPRFGCTDPPSLFSLPPPHPFPPGQVLLNAMAVSSGWVCGSPRSCSETQRSGRPAIFRHPSQFGLSACPYDAPGGGGSGSSGGTFSAAPCSPLRLYVHAICMGSWDGPPFAGSAVHTRNKVWGKLGEGREVRGGGSAQQGLCVRWE